MTHQLKIWPGNYEAVASGNKKHEIRKCTDREFKVGDTVILREWLPVVDQSGFTGEGSYTGRSLMRTITYVSVPGSWGLPDDICVFSMK